MPNEMNQGRAEKAQIEGAEFSQKLDPKAESLIIDALKDIVRDNPDVRSRAILAEFIAEVMPWAKPYSESMFRILSGAVEVDETGSAADWKGFYQAIDEDNRRSQPDLANEKSGDQGRQGCWSPIKSVAVEQKAVAQHAIPRVMKIAQTLIDSGIRTPEGLAQALDSRFKKKCRKFSQAYWNAFGMVDPSLSGRPDWVAIYERIDREPEVDNRNAISSPSLRTRPMKSYVYVFRHCRMPDLVKVGFTDLSPQQRSDALFTTSVPGPFSLCYSVRTDDGRQLEQKIHCALSRSRVHPDREFFKADVESVIAVIREIISKEKIVVCDEMVHPRGVIREDTVPKFPGIYVPPPRKKEPVWPMVLKAILMLIFVLLVLASWASKCKR